MRLEFPELTDDYRSPSQRIRVLSESWLKEEMYCLACGCEHLEKLPNNSRLADFVCGKCGEIYELKSKGGTLGKSILDGAYHTALERITSSTNPNLFVLRYRKNLIEDLILIPKYFFTPDTLRMRRALSPTARRAGYVGSMILYGEIPEYGKIAVIESHTERDKLCVMKSYMRASMLRLIESGEGIYRKIQRS